VTPAPIEAEALCPFNPRLSEYFDGSMRYDSAGLDCLSVFLGWFPAVSGFFLIDPDEAPCTPLVPFFPFCGSAGAAAPEGHCAVAHATADRGPPKILLPFCVPAPVFRALFIWLTQYFPSRAPKRLSTFAPPASRSRFCVFFFLGTCSFEGVGSRSPSRRFFFLLFHRR